MVNISVNTEHRVCAKFLQVLLNTTVLNNDQNYKYFLNYKCHHLTEGPQRGKLVTKLAGRAEIQALAILIPL